VTQSADVDARRVIRSLHRDHPNAGILVTGCYAQRAPEELASLDGVRWVVGNSHKTLIPEIVADHQPYHGRIFVGDIAAQRDFRATPVRDIREDRTRPNLKVQDGCGNRCSFCIIPSVRGRSRSAPLSDVVAQVNDLASRYCEVVLSGINLGRWGRDIASSLRFVDLLRRLLEQTPVKRLRISSVEPMDWSEDLLQLIASEPRIARHVHIPLQSGSDMVLKRMRRRYRIRHYASRLELAHCLLPDAAIGADVMTGFPGETDDEFQETVRFIEQQPFTYLHVFTYSERPGTDAAEASDPVPVAVRRERTRVLRELSEQKSLEFRRRMIGRTLSAVTLEQRGVALTTNFLKVELTNPREPNHMIDLRVTGLSPVGLREESLLPVLPTNNFIFS
jgi:threonylcarbamoyladenosine tRNA methylthiotransferase MtaB